jgi:hypothetical protein
VEVFNNKPTTVKVSTADAVQTNLDYRLSYYENHSVKLRESTL